MATGPANHPEEGAASSLFPLRWLAGPRSLVPSWLRPGLFKARAARWGRRSGDVVPVSAEFVATARPPGLASPRGDLAPPVAGPLLETGDPAPKAGKTLNLEYADQPVLQGRPRWDPRTGISAVIPDGEEPTTWVSALAFAGVQKPSRTANVRVEPTSRVVKTAEAPRGPSVAVSRFLRRVRGAGRAFLDPDSVGREPGDLPKLGEGVQHATADRLDEPAKR
jgi:hypothetical protein